MRLIRRLAVSRDDQEAWEELYRAAWPYVFATAYRLTSGRRDRAQDASQEVFYRLLRYGRFAELETAQQCFGYLAAVCRNVVHDLSRVSAGEATLSYTDVPRNDSDEASPESVAAAVRLRDDLLKHLDQKTRQLAELLIDGHSLAEIARRLGITYGNAAVRVHRLRLALKATLQRREPGPEA